jgi:hypothetical protein
MTAVAMAEAALSLSTQRLLFAGQTVLFRTNSRKIAWYAGEFFPESQDTAEALARITIHVRASEESSESAPLFRARGHFAYARFTLADVFFFNLRTREVCGTCSQAIADDYRRWRTHIFPAILGILSAAIDVAPVHAACVARGGAGVLMSGRSGAGKSTLTIAMAKRGYSLLSDDWTYLSPRDFDVEVSQVEAFGLPIPVKLLPESSAFFPDLLAYSPDVSLNGEVAYEVDPEECFGVKRILRCPLKAVVLLERVDKRGCSIVSISSDEGFRHLAAEVEPLEGLLASCYSQQLRQIQRTVNGVPCYRISFNDHPENVARALDDVLSIVR